MRSFARKGEYSRRDIDFSTKTVRTSIKTGRIDDLTRLLSESSKTSLCVERRATTDVENGLVSYPFHKWKRVGRYSEKLSEYFAYLLNPFFHFGPRLPNRTAIFEDPTVFRQDP